MKCNKCGKSDFEYASEFDLKAERFVNGLLCSNCNDEILYPTYNLKSVKTNKIMRKNEYIKRFLELDLDKKIPIIIKSLHSNENISRLLNLLDNENFWHYLSVHDENTHNIKLNNKNFIEENKDNIILNSIGRDNTYGSYIDPKGNFAFSFTLRSKDIFDELHFYSKDGLNKHIQKFIKDNIILNEIIRDLTYNLLVYKNQQYRLSDFSMKPITKLSVEDNYNDDFLEVHKKLYDNLSKLDKSFTILHGLPGTGKTTYIKYLSHLLEKNFNKEFVYLPPSATSMLSEPSFVESLELLKDKIVLIEEAENILIKSMNRSDAINNILNITDGMLSDMFNVHFLFTFNTSINNIDDALLRKGRLTLKYEFKELSEEKTRNLTKKLGGKMPNKCTLAEIYNQDETGAEVKNQTKLGF